MTNSSANLALAGTMTTTNTRINTDFTLEQDLSFITKGLSARAMISWDNVFKENNRGVNDLYHDPQFKWVDPATGAESYKTDFDANNKFDYQQGALWTIQNGEVDNKATQRNMNYQVQLNWAREFGSHNVTAMGLFSRQQYATGSMIPTYREDWAFRTTYDYADRYFLNIMGLIMVLKNSHRNIVSLSSIQER